MVSGSSKKPHVLAKEQILSGFLEAHEPAKTAKWQHLTNILFMQLLTFFVCDYCTNLITWFLIFVLELSRK